MMPIVEKIKTNRDSLESLKLDLDNYDRQSKLIEVTYQIEMSGDYGLAENPPNYLALKEWVYKLYSLTYGKIKGKSSASKSFNELLNNIKKDDLLRLKSTYQENFPDLCPLLSRL